MSRYEDVRVLVTAKGDSMGQIRTKTIGAIPERVQHCIAVPGSEEHHQK